MFQFGPQPHSETVGWSQMRNSRNQMRRSREIRLQLLNISALFFPLPPPLLPSSIDSSFSDSSQALQSISGMAVVNSCRTTQLFNSSTAGKKTKQKKTACFWKASRRVQELLEELRQSVVPPCHGRCLLMTWQRCHHSKVTRANLGYFRREARRKLFFFSPPR